MEVVGLVASITQLLDVTAKTIKYINKVRDASDDRSRLLREVSSLLPLLANLENQVRLAQCTEAWFDCVRCLAIHGGPIDQLRESLEELARKLKPKKGLKNITHAFVWTFDKAYCEGILEKIERLKTRISLAIQGDTFTLTQAIKADTADLGLIDERVSTISRDIKSLQIDEEAKRRQDILEWFSPLNFLKTQQDIFTRREEGTGQWFLELPVFQNWLSGAVRILCCPGIPGAGKSTLASVVVDFLRTLHVKYESVGVTAIYCNFKERDSQSPENLLAGCCAQLFQYRLPQALTTLHSLHEVQKTKPAWKDIRNIFKDCVASYDTVYVVIDALDECVENVRNILLTHFKASPSNVGLLVTTRHIGEIDQDFDAFHEIRASPSDLRRYILSRINGNSRLAGFVRDHASLQQDICDGIVSKADGMFLAAKLQSDMLSTKVSVKMLRKALADLSNDLDVLYDDALLRIVSQHQDERELAEKALCWIAYSFRPLSADELQEALAIHPEEKDFDMDALPSMNLILDVCAGLLVHDQENRKIRLVHSTAQDYFNRLQHSKFTEAHPIMAMDCLTYLSYECFQSTNSPVKLIDIITRAGMGESVNNEPETSIEKPTEICSDLSKRYFLGYASFLWARHAMIRQDDHLSSQIHQFLKSSPRICLATPFNKVKFQRIWDLRTRQGFEIAAFFGFIAELKGFILDEESNEDIINSFHLLHIAAEGNQSTAIEVLLDLGADIEGRKDGLTPLLTAIQSQSLEVLATLIDRGADVMAVNTERRRRSAIASIRSFPVAPYVKILLAAGAVPRTEDIFEYTPLMAVLMEADDVDAAKELFELHTFHNKVETAICSSALSVASHLGLIKWVEMLLHYGADVNGTNQNGRSGYSWGFKAIFGFPLMSALVGGHEESALTLLHWSADVNLHDEDGFTALHIASAIGSLSMIDELIKHHASADIRSKPVYVMKYIESLDRIPFVSGQVFDLNVHQNSRILMFSFPPNIKSIGSLLKQQKPHEARVWEDGMTALDIAMFCENEEATCLLKSSTASPNGSDPIPSQDWLENFGKEASAEEKGIATDACSMKPQLQTARD